MFKFIKNKFGFKEPPEIKNNEDVEEEVKQRLDFLLSATESDFCHVESKSKLETEKFIRTNILQNRIKSIELK